MTYISSGEQGSYGRLPSPKRLGARGGALASTDQHRGKVTFEPESRASQQDDKQSAQQLKRYAELQTSLQGDVASSGRFKQKREEGFFRHVDAGELPYRQRKANDLYRENQVQADYGNHSGVLIGRVDYYA